MKEHGICAKCKKSVGCPYADDRIKGCKKFVLEDELELTNEEYIRTCSTEELAIFLCNELQHDVNGTLENRFFKKLYSQYPIRPMNAYHEVMRWLKEKHNG